MSPLNHSKDLTSSNNRPSYSVERWPLGWVVCGSDFCPEIPMAALEECGSKLFEGNAVIDSGITHHLRMTGKSPHAVFCVVSPKESKKWRDQITEESSGWDKQKRWFTGVSVGASSAALFSVFCGPEWTFYAKGQGGNSIPHDADDFSRCKGLLDQFPEWRQDLHMVAEAYPDTAWPQLIARLAEIENASPEGQDRIISNILVDFSHATS